MKLLKRLLIRILLVILVAVALFLVGTPLGRYIARAGFAEAEILLTRRPIDEVLRDTTVEIASRKKLEVVVEARSFAANDLKLEAGESFTQFTQLNRDTLVLVLSAAQQDKLVQHTWWFPVVGRLPYKGYFNFDKARSEAEKMAGDGYDVSLRPAAAFSTLGWFNDPLLSTTLAADSIDLVDTVIHELTHNTFFAKGQAAFNESFANFVGSRGAAEFFRVRGDTASATEAENRWYDQQVLGRYWASLYKQLDSVFNANPDDRTRRLQLRDSVYASARRTLVDSLSKEVRSVPAAYMERVRLDNASLLARRVYATDLEVFDALYELEGRDIHRSIARVIELAKGSRDPGKSVRDWVAARR